MMILPKLTDRQKRLELVRQDYIFLKVIKQIEDAMQRKLKEADDKVEATLKEMLHR